MGCSASVQSSNGNPPSYEEHGNNKMQNNNGNPQDLLPQPTNPSGTIYVIECHGGSDKGPDGHRRDTIPICNALISKGWYAQPLFYSDSEKVKIKNKLLKSDGYISRINPGYFLKYIYR